MDMPELKSIYGANDSRQNFFHMKDDDFLTQVKKCAKSTACLIPSIFLVRQVDNWKLSGQTPALRNRTHQGQKMGEQERFIDEPMAGIGTAFLMSKRHAMTAAHCVCKRNSNELDHKSIGTLFLVFGYRMKDEATCKRTFKGKNVYQIRSVVAHKFERQGNWEDWAVVELDRDVVDRSPLSLSFSEKLEKSTGLYMLGHPTGLPLKFTGNAMVKESSHPHRFAADLDAFAGNSGSPVFDLTHRVVGILIEGQADYEVTENYKGTGAIRVQTAHTSPHSFEGCTRINSLGFVHAILASIEKVPIGVQKIGTVKPGLNIEAQCSNPECSNANSIFIVNRGFGKFNMNRECATLTCPQCKSESPYEHTNVLTLSNCTYQIEGTNTKNLPINRKAALEPGHPFTMDMQDWKYLELQLDQLK